MASTSKRLLRILLAAGVVATAWIAVDLLTGSDSASAAEPIDGLADTVSAIVDPVAPIVNPVTAPVVETVVDLAEPVVAPVASITAPVTAPVVSSVIAPLAPVIQTVTEPLAPVAHAALDPFAPTLAPLLPVVAEVLGVQPVAALIGAPAYEALAVAGESGAAVVMAASSALLPMLPGSPLDTPLQAPVSPSAGTSAPLTAVAVLLFGMIAALGVARSARPGALLRPLAPTFASDTTPD